MSTIFHSTEAVTTSLTADSSSPCKVARGVVRPAELNCCIYSIILCADYERFASSVSVPYVIGECAMRRIAFYSFDCITLFNFIDILLTFWFFFFHSDCEIGRDASTFMPLIHQSLCTGLCVFFFLYCV